MLSTVSTHPNKEQQEIYFNANMAAVRRIQMEVNGKFREEDAFH